MRVTIEISENKLDQILKATGQKKKSPALAMALNTYLKDRERQAFLDKVHSGQTDYTTSNDEIEEMCQLTK